MTAQARKPLSDFVSYCDFFRTTSISTINFQVDVSRKGRMSQDSLQLPLDNVDKVSTGRRY
jgi:hypothetical protein